MTEYQCCFCGQAIEEHAPDPVRLTIALPEGAEQHLYCHWQHLKEAMHTSVPLYVWEGK
jgi:hypothetical protein